MQLPAAGRTPEARCKGGRSGRGTRKPESSEEPSESRCVIILDRKSMKQIRQPFTPKQLEVVKTIAPQGIVRVEGDCLESAGIFSGGMVAIDFTRFPAPPRYISKGGDGSSDICACWAVFPGRSIPTFMVKEYLGLWGGFHTVGTRYDLSKGEHPHDLGMFANSIVGVVFASWDGAGHLIWKRDPESFQTSLWSIPTIVSKDIAEVSKLNTKKEEVC